MGLRVRATADADRPWLRGLIRERWGTPVVTPTGPHDAPELYDGVVAEVDGQRAGAATYLRQGDDWEIVVVIATVERAGVGRAMLEEIRRLAQQSGATRLWLITTDDSGATPFYERLGMVRARTHEDFVDVVRRWKPSTDGYRDAHELEWRFDVG